MRVAMLAAAAVAVAGGAALAQPMMNMAPMSTPQFLTAAAQSDEFEVTEGRLAQMHGASPSVREMGAMMVRDHSMTTDNLRKAVAAADMTPPPPPPLRPDQQQEVSQLQGLSGPAFDRTYVAQQIASHREALMVQTNYARTGDKEPIKAAARETQPIVQSHLSKFEQLQAQMGGA